MTRTLTSTPAEWEVLQRDRTAWIVRDDPAELVAAAAPCETCRGQREVSWRAGAQQMPAIPCGDCRITLVRECPTCRGRGRKWRGGAPCACEAPGCEWGTVTLGYAYADSEVLPIVAGDEQPARPDEDNGDLAVWDDRSVSWRKPAWQVWPAVTADLAHYGDLRALVGRYALKVRLA